MYDALLAIDEACCNEQFLVSLDLSLAFDTLHPRGCNILVSRLTLRSFWTACGRSRGASYITVGMLTTKFRTCVLRFLRGTECH